MKRFEDKIKDLVEIREFPHLSDFLADQAAAVAGYRFTDITSDLLAKWIDRLAQAKPGETMPTALAGYRGAGKSHFLAVLTALLTQPELRRQLRDEHVASALGQLSRRRFTVAFVRRGTGASLMEEFRFAITEALNLSSEALPPSLSDLLSVANQHAGDQPLVVLIDTAAGRESRVARDDGQLLSEIAEAARALGIYVGVALDDDISGADGANSAILKSFSIDYLDQEHLYKIVDLHIFLKQAAKLGVIHEVYQDVRQSLPGFNWSEQRFAMLYPLHPATLEMAPFIRLYIQDFGLLGFAAEYGQKVLGHPANSLIGLDEMFVAVEKRLRAVEDLKQAWETFDRLEKEVVEKSAVFTRLQSKLALRALFLLSLRGRGTTSTEIASSMMIFGESPIDEVLKAIAEAEPETVVATPTDDGLDVIYWFKTLEAAAGGEVLDEAVEEIGDDSVWQLLLRQMSERFSDLGPVENGLSSCVVEWRGGLRTGEVVWDREQIDTNPETDWKVVVQKHGETPIQGGPGVFCWQVAEPTADEIKALKQNLALHADAALRDKLSEGAGATMQVNSLAAERIWKRLFIDDAAILGHGFRVRFDEESASSHTLAQLFCGLLGPAFEKTFPQHPYLAAVLGQRELGKLITDFLGGGDLQGSETQSLAEKIAVPLGLAIRRENHFSPRPIEEVLDLDLLKAAINLDEADTQVIELTGVARKMRATEFGLSKEAQYLLLASLVAQKRFDFVTSSGNRINHRSLDLQMVWDDIVGLAVPAVEDFTTSRLAAWASLLTGSEIASLGESETAKTQLAAWLKSWRADRVMERFNSLEDDDLNVALWKIATNVKRTFGASADAVSRIFTGDCTIDDALKAVADLFTDSEAEFERRQADLSLLQAALEAIATRREIESYVLLAEITDDPNLEAARRSVLDELGQSPWPPPTGDALSQKWIAFHSLYVEHFVKRHEEQIDDHGSQTLLEQFLNSEMWSAFQICGSTPWFEKGYAGRAQSALRKLRARKCSADVRTRLQLKPSCVCDLSIAYAGRTDEVFAEFRTVVERGLDSFRSRLRQDARSLSTAVLAAPEQIRTGVESVLEAMEAAPGFPAISAQDVRVLKAAYDLMIDDPSLSMVESEAEIPFPKFEGANADLYA
nr:hypothetical protein [uncultured bacterium]